MKAVNAGSGQRRFETIGDVEWVNVDIISRPPDQIADVHYDISRPGWPFDNGSVDVVVLSQVIEHFHLTEGDVVLTEAYRILKPGGSLIATFPNLKALAKAWIRGDITDYIFGVNVYGAWQGQPGDDHHWHYSSLTLAAQLMGLSDWSKVRAFDWRAIPGMNLGNDWWVDSCEAIK